MPTPTSCVPSWDCQPSDSGRTPGDGTGRGTTSGDARAEGVGRRSAVKPASYGRQYGPGGIACHPSGCSLIVNSQRGTFSEISSPLPPATVSAISRTLADHRKRNAHGATGRPLSGEGRDWGSRRGSSSSTAVPDTAGLVGGWTDELLSCRVDAVAVGGEGVFGADWPRVERWSIQDCLDEGASADPPERTEPTGDLDMIISELSQAQVESQPGRTNRLWS
jgi:hypothetical protein